ncbi:MAG: hypothetical protein KF696_12350 [Planctomycetes bacterium]|nr:hypothetical protein [Planctomycetota bacterium]MCW8136589.1 hypothetical protein [Planctomycetota bacterium]
MENRNESAKPADYQKAVRKRLTELRDRHGLSKIARRTHTPLTNVHRYMREGKVPAEFCAALVDAFEVNPGWLLTGHGGALLSDVDEGAAKLGGNLLELITAMNAVSRMRVGALAGKEQEKRLRELSDAMDTYERLRERMNQQARPLMRELVHRFATLDSQMQLERAARVRQVAQQVSRFCQDDELLYEFDREQAMHEHLCGRVEAALKFHSRLFSTTLLQGGLSTPRAMDEAANYVLALRDSGRFKEGLRVAEAALHLSTDEVRATRAYHEMVAVAGAFQIELGELRTGLSRIHAAFQAVPAQAREFIAIFKARAEWLADLVSLRELRHQNYPSRGRTRMIMRGASLTDDGELLTEVLKSDVGDGVLQVPANEYETRRAVLIGALLARRKGNHYADYAAMLDECPPPVNSPALRELVAAIHLGQAARLAGKRAEAARQVERTESLLAALPSQLTIPVDLYGLHVRNLRHAGRDAENRLPGLVAQGYTLLQRFIEDDTGAR